MAKYVVKKQVTGTIFVEVEADNENEALSKAKVDDSEDYDSLNIKCEIEECLEDE